MRKSTALFMATDQQSTAVQLTQLVGYSDETDRLLAQHPNTPSAMLAKLAKSSDRQTLRAVAAHGNTPIEVLDRLGVLFPSSIFRNPNLSRLLKKSSNYLKRFEGKPFERALKLKRVPDVVVNWLVSKGNLRYQSIFLSSAGRSESTILLFRKSKHAEIANSLALHDDETYINWALELGFKMPAKALRGDIQAQVGYVDLWVYQLWQKSDVFWERWVDETGSEKTIQGELLKAIVGIEGEYHRNGMMNWGDGYYERLAAFLHSTLRAEPSFGPIAKRVLDHDIAEIERSGQIGMDAADGKVSPFAVFSGSILRRCSIRESHSRLTALVALWCLRHKKPVPLFPS